MCLIGIVRDCVSVREEDRVSALVHWRSGKHSNVQSSSSSTHNFQSECQTDLKIAATVDATTTRSSNFMRPHLLLFLFFPINMPHVYILCYFTVLLRIILHCVIWLQSLPWPLHLCLMSKQAMDGMCLPSNSRTSPTSTETTYRHHHRHRRRRQQSSLGYSKIYWCGQIDY